MFRTIWIVLRAQNYTMAAFSALDRSIDKLMIKERELLRASQALSQVGIMFIAMGMTAVGAIMSIISKSSYGERMLTRFSKQVDKALGELGTKLAKALLPILNIVLGLIRFITKLPFSEYLILGAAAALLLGGALMFVAGVVKSLIILTPILTVEQMKQIPILGALIAKTWAWVAAQIAAHGALAPLVAALAIGAAATVTAYAAHQAGAFQMGTSFVQKGGWAIVHGGEEIKSARETRVPSLIEREPTRRTYNIRFDIGHLHTKADKEEMVDVIRKALRSVT